MYIFVIFLGWMKERERANISTIKSEFEKLYNTKASQDDLLSYNRSLASSLYA